MTREEAKQAAEVMLAYANGKKIQYFDNNKNEWITISLALMETSWDWSKYRIAPDQEQTNQEPKEKHYRPYTMEEFVQDMHKHDGFVRQTDINNYGELITLIAEDCVNVEGYCFGYAELCDDFVWSDDGQPCGKEVTELCKQ